MHDEVGAFAVNIAKKIRTAQRQTQCSNPFREATRCTGRGPGASMAFALKVVEELAGPAVAKTTAERLLFVGS